MHPGAHCDDAGTWGESPVPPATATFTPISAPPLPPGRWQILAANDADDPDDDATSVEFTVTPCDGSCPLEVGPGRKVDFERARKVVLDSVEATCKGLNAVGVYQALRAAQFETEMVLAFPGGAGGTFAVTWGQVAEGAKIVVKTSARLVGPTKLGKNAYLDWAAWFACQAYDLAKKLSGQGDSSARTARSPRARLDATPAYEVVPKADFPTLPSLDEPAVDNLGVHLAGIEGNMDAVEVGWDRMVAAREASADDWEHAQARGVGAAGLELARHARRAAASLRGFADVAAADPDIPDPLVTQQDIDEAADVRARVRASGLTSDEIADLKAQGATDADVEALKTIVARDVSDAPIGRSLPDLIRDEAQSYEDLIAPADALGREAAAVAGRTNLAPHAAFSITGVSGPAPQPATFTDESDDPDHDPLAVTWDFGDGTFGVGSNPSHTYLADGQYTVTQTVSDGYTTDTATRTVTVGEPNQAPTAAFTAAPATGAAPLDVSFNATSSSDPDGQVTAYNWDFGDGGTGSGATISAHLLRARYVHGHAHRHRRRRRDGHLDANRRRRATQCAAHRLLDRHADLRQRAAERRLRRHRLDRRRREHRLVCVDLRRRQRGHRVGAVAHLHRRGHVHGHADRDRRRRRDLSLDHDDHGDGSRERCADGVVHGHARFGHRPARGRLRRRRVGRLRRPGELGTRGASATAVRGVAWRPPTRSRQRARTR